MEFCGCTEILQIQIAQKLIFFKTENIGLKLYL